MEHSRRELMDDLLQLQLVIDSMSMFCDIPHIKQAWYQHYHKDKIMLVISIPYAVSQPCGSSVNALLMCVAPKSKVVHVIHGWSTLQDFSAPRAVKGNCLGAIYFQGVKQKFPIITQYSKTTYLFAPYYYVHFPYQCDLVQFIFLLSNKKIIHVHI